MQKLESFDVQADMIKRFGELTKFSCEKHGEYETWKDLEGCAKCSKEKSDAEERKERQELHVKHMAARWARCGMPEKFCGVTIDNWYATTSEQKAVKKNIMMFISGDIKRMLLMGNCGTGKTMLAAGVIAEMALMNNFNPIYTTATRLIRTIRDSWRDKETTEQEAMNVFINADVLVVDELGAGRCSEDDKLILSEILCDRYAADAPTLLISNMNGSALKESVLDDRAIDRMREGGKVITMSWESYRGK